MIPVFIATPERCSLFIGAGFVRVFRERVCTVFSVQYARGFYVFCRPLPFSVNVVVAAQNFARAAKGGAS